MGTMMMNDVEAKRLSEMSKEESIKIVEDAINRYEKSKDVKCFWEGIKPGTPMCMSCPCPKCSMYS